MPLQKQPVNINFTQGVDTKSDPYQLPIGRFQAMNNSQFGTTGRMTKRDGFPQISKLPNADQTTLTTMNGNLIATGTDLLSYNQQLDTWQNQGTIQPVSIEVQSLIRNSYSQIGSDMAVADNGLICLAFLQDDAAYYTIIDSITGQSIVSPNLIAATATNVRVFQLGRYFILTFTATVAAASHLQYLAIPILNPENPGSNTDISTSIPALDIGYDAVVANNTLYIAYQDDPDVEMKYLTSTLVLSSAIVVTGYTADLMAMTADNSGSLPTIWMAFWDEISTDGYAAAFSANGAVVLAPEKIIDGEEIEHITASADDMRATVLFEVANDYQSPYPTASVKSNYIDSVTITEAGSVGVQDTVIRSVGLASKAFFVDDSIYFIATYGGANQPTYFLVDSLGQIYAKFAYANGIGYKPSQVLCSVTEADGVYYYPYEMKDFLTTTNKATDQDPAPASPNAIYTQTGINLLKFSINTAGQYSADIASALHLTGGFMWQYDGVAPVEHSFHLWPEDVAATIANSDGTIGNGTYYYRFCYEWTDNQGMLHRSAPSIPLLVTLAGVEDTVTLYVPNLRLTYKTNVRIVGYRWSVLQQTYYQFTSIEQPALSSTTTDYSTIIDTLPDEDILGNPILYTTGGVIENIATPAIKALTLFKNRLCAINAENPNEIWYSKQIIQSTPVEMSDLLTIFIAPTTGVQGSTGPCRALSAMDDKLIIFKDTAIYYLTGIGPDNTGGNNDFTDPVFITSSVGCSNPASIVLVPAGLMFQSGKGIWLLGRDLSTKYIGDAVEAYNDIPVVSALAIPGTNQVRFTLSNSITLMFDYYYTQWATFDNQQAISSCLYEDAHTYLNRFGQIMQQTEGSYLDGSRPVLMSVSTGWINVAGLQGYERFYEMLLLGTYKSPFKLNVEIQYDYNPNTRQSIIVTPDNYSPNWGGDSSWGATSPWGGPSKDFKARIFPNIQKCEAFQVTITEIYDPSYGVPAGEGLTLSGMNLVVGIKKGQRTSKAGQSFG